MTLLALPKRGFSQQPTDWQNVEIDRGGLGRYVTDYFVPDGGTNTRGFMLNIGRESANLLPRSEPAATTGPNISSRAVSNRTKQERALKYTDAVNMGGSVGTGNPILRNLQNFTVICCFTHDFHSPIHDQRVFSKDNGTGEGNHRIMVGLQRVGAEDRMRSRIKINGTTQTLVTAVDMVIDGYHQIAASWDGTTMRLRTVAPNQVEEITSTAPSGDLTIDNQLCMFGRTANSATNFFAGSIHQCLFFDGAVLSDEQLADWYINPWQLLQEKRRPLIDVAVAAPADLIAKINQVNLAVRQASEI